MRIFLTKRQEMELLLDAYHYGYRQGTKDTLLEATHEVEEKLNESYNQGKADGIKLSKEAFAKAVKQKGE